MEINAQPATPEPVVEAAPTDSVVVDGKEPITPKPPVEAAPPTEPAAPTWQQELEKADAKDLRRHPKVAGLIGSEIQRAIERDRLVQQEQQEARARQEAEANLRRLAQEDPATFAENWLSQDAQQQLGNQVTNIRSKTRDEMALSLSAGAKSLPEWQHVTESDMQALATALAGKKDDEVLPVFLHQLVDTVSRYRAKALHEEWKAKELEDQRKAIRNEEAAKLMKRTGAPDLALAKGPAGKVNVGNMSTKEFDELSPPNESVADAIRRLHGG